MNPVALDDGRPVWNSAKAFVLTVAGGSNGFGSFFRLPLMFVAFGVGNFLVPYFVCLIFIAYPLAALEIFLGCHHRKASAGVFAEIHPRAVGIGYAMPLLGCVLVGVYSSAMLSWTALPFLIESFAKQAPYDFKSPNETRAYWESRALFHADSGNFEVFMVLAAVWVLACVIAARGIRSVMVAVYFTVPIPILFLTGLMIYACAVADGPALGRALTPSVDGVFNFRVWANAAGQALLATQAGTGNLVAFGSFCRPVHNAFNIATAILVQALVCSAAFGVTTACAMTLMDWGYVTEQSFRAGFFVPLAVFASLLARTDASGPVAIFFFACVLLLGLGNLATAVQILYSILWDFAVRLRGRKLGVCIGLGAIALSAPLMLHRSYDVITAADQATVSVILPVIAAMESLAVGYLWADKGILATLNERATSGGWGRFKAFLSIAFNQSIGKIKELVESQGRSSVVASALPIFVKLLIPLSCLVVATGNAVEFARDWRLTGAPGALVALLLVAFLFIIVLVNAIAAPAKAVPLPWNDDVTMNAVTAVTPSSIEHRPPADSMELRCV